MPSEAEAIKSEVIMEIKHLTKRFPVGDKFLTACDDINLSVKRGKTLGIVGESGCGKSTLVKTIMRMHPATEGEVIVDGEDILKLKGAAAREANRHIQMVFQDPALALNPKLRVKDIICESLLNYGLIKKADVTAKARELLRQVELPEDFAERYPGDMSGGQRQRVGIARALALEPEIIVCDESTSALDVSVQAKVIELLTKLQREKNITYLFICHDLALVSLLSHRIVVMYLGNAVEIIDGDKLSEAHHPYTQALLRAVFPLEKERHNEVEVLTGDIPSPLDLPVGCPFQNRCRHYSAVCSQSKPKLVETEPEHFVACHLYSGK